MNVYKSVQDSLYAACLDFKTDDGWTATIYNFDAYSEQNKLPDGDLIGLNGFTMDVDTDLITVHCRIGIATENDKNLFRLEEKAGKLLQRFAPGTHFKVYDVDAANAEVGDLVIDAGVSVSPVYQAISKPLKFLAFTAKSSVALSR